MDSFERFKSSLQSILYKMDVKDELTILIYEILLKSVLFNNEGCTIEEIVKIAKENRVEKIVIGVPVNMDGSLGFQAEDCINFSQKIHGFDIIQEDERLTSEEAEERLRSRRVDFRKNKGLVDMESACVILEQYLGK